MLKTLFPLKFFYKCIEISFQLVTLYRITVCSKLLYQLMEKISISYNEINIYIYIKNTEDNASLFLNNDFVKNLRISK